MVALEPSFCPQCGAPLDSRRVEGRERAYCPDCETVVWQNPVPTAGVAVVDGERVLLVRRKHDPDAGTWSLPAGFVEVDETAPAAAARELAEEAGLDVAPDSLTLLSVGRMPHPTGRSLITVGFGVARAATTGDPVAGSDALDARFVSPATHDASTEPIRAFDEERISEAIERFGRRDTDRGSGQCTEN